MDSPAPKSVINNISYDCSGTPLLTRVAKKPVSVGRFSFMKKYKYWSFQTFIFIVVLTLIILLSALWFNIALLEQISGQTPPSNSSRGTKHSIFAKTLLEYQLKMNQVSSQDRVILHLVPDEPLFWDSNSSIILGNTEKIYELYLQGPISIKVLFEIINQSATNLRGLYLNDSGNGKLGLCSFSESGMLVNYEQNIIFNRLRKLSILNISCGNVIEILNQAYMPTVIELEYNSNSNVRGNINLFKRVCLHSRNSLGRVTVNEIEETNLLSLFTVPIPYVSHVTLNSNKREFTEIELGHLRTLFPRLQVLVLNG